MAKSNDPFKSVPKQLWPVQEEVWAREFIPCQIEALDHINDLAEQNVFDNKTVLNHRQLVNWVGGKAFSSFEFSSSKFWSESDTRNQNVEWNLALWQFIHVFPIGFLIANHSLRSEPYRSWNPASESIRSFSKRGVYIANSNRSICGAMVGLGLFHKLFIDERTDPAIYKAILDAFSPYSNLDNPISASMRRAIRATLFSAPYPVPFFWEKAIAHLFERSPEDFESYQNHLKFGAAVNPDDVAASLQKSIPTVSQSKRQREELSEAPEEILEALAPDSAEEVALHPRESHREPDGAGSSNEVPVFELFIEQIKLQYESHKNPLNTKGAMFHKVGEYWFSVHPIVANIALKNINERESSAIDYDSLMFVLNSIGFTESKGTFIQNGEVKSTVNLLSWPSEVIQHVLGDKMDMKANKGLKLVRE
ncbi:MULTISPECIES: hypothetical protein [Vibrio]|uniref:Uncharacterized protein n=1 Tax=Vibrio rotiferianus TaxID=190895 RepID=A0A510IF51_9VIBR|nr:MULTISPECIES: hypothetical protein [Vibrio]BBL92339.1 hypothetical protein VroAM7_49920 [Vibrio rotiferianus]